MNHAVWLHPNAGDAAELTELGVIAEDAGRDGVCVSDSLGGYPTPSSPSPASRHAPTG